MAYILDEDGNISETDQVFTNGRYVYLDGKLVRVGDGKRAPMHYGSDDLGIQGVFNPADGKMYDSKSNYIKAVKAKGLEIIGNDAPVKSPSPKKANINWEKAVAETLKTKPLKGK